MEYLGERKLKGKPVLLRVRFLPDTQSRRSVLVEKVVAPRWVYTGEEEDAAP